MTADLKTQDSTYRVLLIEDNPGYRAVLEKRLSEAERPSFKAEHAGTLQAGLERLSKGGIDIVVLDLSLPDSHGLETFVRVHDEAPSVPAVVLTCLDDEMMGLEAVRQGAQEYLIKSRTEAEALLPFLRHAIERHRSKTELQNQSLTDELTGLYNRRGFYALAVQELKVAERTKRGLLLALLDLDGLKAINDNFGHFAGDRALQETASLLRATFRGSDIVARVGGDEFALLAIEAHKENIEGLKARLKKHLEDFNREGKLPFPLSLSTGMLSFEVENPPSLEEWMAEADRAMYREKERKRG